MDENEYKQLVINALNRGNECRLQVLIPCLKDEEAEDYVNRWYKIIMETKKNQDNKETNNMFNSLLEELLNVAKEKNAYNLKSKY